MKKYNYALAALLLFVGAGMIYLTLDFPYSGLSDIGGGFWPKLLGALLMLCSIGLVIDTAVGKESGLALDFGTPGMKRVVKMCVVMAVFCVIMKLLGFMIGIIFMVPACARLLGAADKKKLALITAGVVVFVYVVFEMMLHTGLPSGILF